MTLDLTAGAALEPAYRDELNAIALETRDAFNDLVRRVGAPHHDNIDWWVTPVAARNIFSSDLFLRCCQLVLVMRAVARRDRIACVVADSPGLAAALRRALASCPAAPRVEQPRHASYEARALLLRARRLCAVVFHAAGQLIFSRLIRGARALPAGEALVLVDTFVYRNSFDGAYRDRHYPRLLEYLDEDQRRTVYFVPTYYRIRNYARLFSGLRRSGVNFLVKEDYLRFSDYLHALGHPFRLRAFAVATCEHAGVDAAPLVNEALRASFAASGSIEGLLRYRLAQRLSEARVSVRAMVDWFENQELDHGWNAGFRRFFPQVPTIGYQGFVVSRHYLCMFPTEDEARLRLIPHRVAVVGAALVDAAREFCPELEVAVAPAFRFDHVWRDPAPRDEADPYTILVALPLVGDESNRLVEVIAAATAHTSAWAILVKPHPASPRGSLGRHSQHFQVVTADFDTLIDHADVLVSAASSACVEAVARGIPVVVLGSRDGLTLNPIPETTSPELWALCHDAGDVRLALERFEDCDPETLDRRRALGEALRERLFTRPTREGVEALLMLHGSGSARPAMLRNGAPC